MSETTEPDVLSLTYAERKALPVVHHRPVFQGLGKPHGWACAVCWDEGLIEGWPCETLTKGTWQDNVELAKSLGVEWSA